jgi:hypothetical protein
MDIDPPQSGVGLPLHPERERRARYLAEVRRDENFPAGLVGGLLAAVVAAGLWASLTALVGVQFGWLALGVGAMVGVAVRRYGRGLGLRFGLAAAGFTLVGCLLGDLAAAYLLVAQQFGLSGVEMMALVRLDVMREFMVNTFSILDAVFYGVALVLAYNIAFRHVRPPPVEAVPA